jgi:hypothetical protein
MTGLQALLVALQAFQVLHLAIHDWVPLGRLNNVQAVRQEVSVKALGLGTLISTLPFALGLLFSVRHLGTPFPAWLKWWLGLSYGFLFLGELEAWWIPYLLVPQPKKAVRYGRMFGGTHAFLPSHNGIVPNSLHVVLHLATAVTLLILMAGV